LHSLADIHSATVSPSQSDKFTIQLHFDADSTEYTVRSKRGSEASLIVIPDRERPPIDLRIRVPSWVTREKARLEMAGKPLPLRWEGSYLLVGRAEIADRTPITLRYDLPPGQTVEEMPVSHSKFNLTWQGDEVVACDPKVPIYAARA
jgi:hypothetical protein